MRYRIDADNNYSTFSGQDKEEDPKKRYGEFGKNSVELWTDEGRLFIRQDYSTIEIPRKILGNIIDVLTTLDDHIDYQEEMASQENVKGTNVLKVVEEPENEKG